MARISIGNYHVGPYCGSTWIPLKKSEWKFYKLFRKIDNGFSIGTVLFWKERIVPNAMPEEVGELAKILWETSRGDENSLSATGANILAKVVLGRGYAKIAQERPVLSRAEALAWYPDPDDDEVDRWRRYDESMMGDL